MTLKKHPIWECVVNADDLNSFCQKILPDFSLHPNVPEDIKAELSIAEKLLFHSYYEYDFIDIALTHIVFTLEKAMKLRYAELNGIETDMNFYRLIEWSFKKDFFEIWNNQIIHQLRQIRNNKVHETKNTLGGLAFLDKVKTPLSLINDLYEDINLRIERKKLVRLWSSKLTSFIEKGGIIEIEGKRIIVFHIDILFWDNKPGKENISITVWPIFDPEPYRHNKHFVPNHSVIRLCNVSFVNNTFSGTDIETNQEISLKQIHESANIKKFEQWKKDASALPDAGIIFSLLSVPINSYYYKCLADFYKKPVATQDS